MGTIYLTFNCLLAEPDKMKTIISLAITCNFAQARIVKDHSVYNVVLIKQAKLQHLCNFIISFKNGYQMQLILYTNNSKSLLVYRIKQIFKSSSN